MSRNSWYACLFVLIPSLYFMSLPSSVGDLAIWVSQGLYFIKTGQILRHDIFTIIPTEELIYPALTCIIYGGLHKLGGLDAVVLFHRLLIILIGVFWLKKYITKTKNVWSLYNIYLFFLAWLGCSILFLERPALVAIVPFILGFDIIESKTKLNAWDLLKLSIINIFWVNIHGSWLLLFCMFFYKQSLISVQQKNISKNFILGCVLLITSSFVNPFGAKVFEYVLQTVKISQSRQITEWSSTFNSIYKDQLVVFILLLMTLIYAVVSKNRKNLKKWFLLLRSPMMFLILISLISIRHTIWPFFSLIAFLKYKNLFKSFELGQSNNPQNRLIAASNLIVVCVLIIANILLMPNYKSYVLAYLPISKQKIYDDSAPVEFAKYLSNTNDQEPVFNDWDYGSYLSLSQNHKYFIDTRNIIFNEYYFGEYVKIINAEDGYLNKLEHYKIKYIILDKTLRQKLIASLNQNKSWKIVQESNQTILYEKINL